LKLVSVIPRFGTRVNPIDINEIRAAFEVKITLEGLSGYLAAERVMQDKLAELQTLTDETAQLLSLEGEIKHRQPIPGWGKE
jgi:DNA-binding GntR family transcriptional regulator